MSEKFVSFGARRLPGMEMIEIKPTILGGDPDDPNNKAFVSRQEHFGIVRYWNRIIREIPKDEEFR